MNLPFEAKAEPKALNILRYFEYCLVTPLICVNDFGDVLEGEPVKVTDINIIRNMYNEHYDIMIQTPEHCNY